MFAKFFLHNSIVIQNHIHTVISFKIRDSNQTCTIIIYRSFKLPILYHIEFPL